MLEKKMMKRQTTRFSAFQTDFALFGAVRPNAMQRMCAPFAVPALGKAEFGTQGSGLLGTATLNGVKQASLLSRAAHLQIFRVSSITDYRCRLRYASHSGRTDRFPIYRPKYSILIIAC